MFGAYPFGAGYFGQGPDGIIFVSPVPTCIRFKHVGVGSVLTFTEVRVESLVMFTNVGVGSVCHFVRVKAGC